MGRVNPGRVGQCHQFVVQRVVELVGELIARKADRCQQVGTTDVADEQCVTGEDAVGDLVVGVLVDHDAQRFRGVPRCVAELERHITERVPLTVVDTHKLEFRFGERRIDDLGARGLRQFEVAGQEVGVKVRLDDELDLKSQFFGVGDVLRNVALGVDHHRASGRLVANQV